jgi:alanine racemase
LPQVQEISLMTHFSNADDAKGIAQQLGVFNAASRDLPGERSLSNSAAILRHMGGGATPGLVSDWVRPGIMLYGASPDHPEHGAAHWGLQPAMSLRSRIMAIQDLQAGDSVGYGSTFVAPGSMRIGVVACGYADGYMRSSPGLSDKSTPVLVEGVRTRTVGRVSMDLITVDLSPVPAAGLGSEVTLWGLASSGAALPVDEVAHAGGTVGYELMCALAERVAVTVEP